MSETIAAAIIVGIPPTLAAVGMGLWNGRQGKKIIVRADQIHELTNSNLSAVKQALIDANVKIGKLERALETFQRENR